MSVCFGSRISCNRNIVDLRVEDCIQFDWLVDLLVDFCGSQDSRLNDLSIKLENVEDVHRILESLSNNFMIKTVSLETSKPVEDATVKLAEQFRSKRVATENQNQLKGKQEIQTKWKKKSWGILSWHRINWRKIRR